MREGKKGRRKKKEKREASERKVHSLTPVASQPTAGNRMNNDVSRISHSLICMI